MGRRLTRRHRASIGADVARARRLAALLGPRRLFTREQAAAAMVFLRPVAEDLQAAFRMAVDCHCRLSCAVLREQVKQLEAEQWKAIERFDRALDEVELAGAELLDCCSCVLAFPTELDGEVQHLIWSPGSDDQLHSAAPPHFMRVPRRSDINTC